MEGDRLDARPEAYSPELPARGQQAIAERILPNRLPQQLLYPLRLLKRNHLKLLFYVAAVITAAIAIGSELTRLTGQSVQQLQWVSELHPLAVQAISAIGLLSLGLLAVPVFLTMIALPIEHDWVYGELRFWKLLTETPKLVLVAFQTLVVGIHTGIYYSIPALAVGVGYAFLLERYQITAIPWILHLCAGLILLAVANQILPLLFAPMIAVCGHYTPLGSIRAAPAIVQSQRAGLFLAGGLVTLAFAPLVWAPFGIEALAPYRAPILTCLVCTWIWYGSTVLAHILMNQTGRYAAGAI